MTVQIGDYAKASYDFPGEAASDLPLSVGDIVRLTDVVDGNWATGVKVGVDSRTGTFPLAFVERITLPIVRTGQKVFLSIENFPADQSGDLELHKGDIILGVEPVNESWWRGKNGPLKGIFPLIMVAELVLDDGLRSRSASACSSSLKLRSNSITAKSDSVGEINNGITKVTETIFARALVDVIPQLDGELAFQLGDLIEVTDILGDDWFYGKCHNKEGLVSAVCVEILVESVEANDFSESKHHLVRSESSSNSVSSVHEPEKGILFRNLDVLEPKTGNSLKGSYTSENTRSHDTEVTSYGRVIHPFTAQIPTELSLTENSLVTLIQHVDSDWTEGEIDGKKGLFPTSFIEIIVDCPYSYSPDLKEKSQVIELPSRAKNVTIDVSSNINVGTTSADSSVHEHGSKSLSANSKEHENSVTAGSISVRTELTDELEENHEIGLVLYNFMAEVTEDMSVNEGDTVEVIRSLNENWLKIRTEDGQVGQVPKSYVDIIGSWPKENSKSEFISSARVLSAVSVQGQSSSKDNLIAKSAVTSASEINNSYAGQRSSMTAEDNNYMKASAASTSEHLTPINKLYLLSKGKPPLLPKPALSPKPIIASKPSSVITQQSFMPTKRSSSSKPRTSSLMLEHRTNSLSALDAFIKDEISKAKGSSTSSNSSNSDVSSQALNEIPSSEHLSNASPVLYRGASIDSHDSTHSAVSSLHVSSEQQGIDGPRRTIFTSHVSFSGESTATPDDTNRRRSASFVEQKTRDSPEIQSQHSTFVNKAFQMDTPDGMLIDVNDKNKLPSRYYPVRVAPPRPVSAIVSSTSYTVETPPGKIRGPPPRPTGPRMASAPSKTPLMPTRVESPATLVPKRPAPKAPGYYNKTITAPQQQSVSHSTQSSQRHPPRPSSFPAAPKRPPPRPADLMSFSPDGSGGADVSEDVSTELVADLKSKLEEFQADIKKFEQAQTDLRKNLAQASSQEKEEETKDNLEFVEKQLFGLQEEENKIKENLFALSPHEARLEKARLLAAQHAEEEEKRKEEEMKREEEMKEKRRDQRTKVISEILETEKDYLLSLQFCLETFLDGQKPPTGVDLNFLLGNMEEITDVSQKMVVHLETCTSGKSFDDQHIGKCFIRFAEDMKNTYAPYCRNHDDVITAMERYTENTEINDFFRVNIEKMREHMNVFDVAGILIKPVQRILKYPLLLNELLKNTDEGNSDREDIVAAINAMTDVAKAINEYKRRKDLVYKYKKSTDQTFSDKISKLNMHSIRKKSLRIKGRLSTNFGIGLQMRDEKFEKEEAKFRHLERAVKVFLRSVIQFLDQSQETMQIQEIVVDGIKSFYKDKESEEAVKLHEITVKLLGLYDNMKETVESVIVTSLNTLVGLFSAPGKVIEKRFDKLLDYNYQLGKTESDKELQAARNDYEAMNDQLLDELPKFYNLAFKTLKDCIAVFVHARRDFMDQSLMESCALLTLPSMTKKLPLMETFKTRHVTVFDHLSLLSFIPKGFNPRMDTIKADRAKQKGRAASESVSPQPSTCASSQTEDQKSYLQQHYPASKLYQVTSAYNAVDLMDISLTEGSLVAVIKELDPMGKKDRWFLDNGANKGFAPSSILAPQGSLPPDSDSRYCVEEDLISIFSTDSGDVVFTGNDDRVDYHVSASLEESSSQPQQETQQETQQQYYYALYDFTSRHPNETTLAAGHPVTVLAFHDIEGNSEWWLVETEGNRGYAPANYMAPMPYS